MEDRQLWSQAVDAATLGLSGAAQIFRLDQHVDHWCRGQLLKTTHETRYGALSLSLEQAGPEAVLALVRDYWGIEIRQHYRRDHTQREDHCQVRHPVAARNLSLMRSLAIFLYEQQRGDRAGKHSLPDWQRKIHRHPNALIAPLTAGSV